MNNPLGVSHSKGNQETTRGNEKIFLASVGIEPTASGLDLPFSPWARATQMYQFKGPTESGTDLKVVRR